MANTTKNMSEKDFQQVLRGAFNDVDKTITTNGFLVGKVGHKVTCTISTTNVANDTETYEFLDSGVSLYQLRVIYTDGGKTQLLSAERIA